MTESFIGTISICLVVILISTRLIKEKKRSFSSQNFNYVQHRSVFEFNYSKFEKKVIEESLVTGTLELGKLILVTENRDSSVK
jgi:hypothetical protein